MGLGLGAAAPPMIASMMAVVGWQQALWWTSLPALLLIGVWAWYGRNRPAEHRSVTAPELALVAEVAGDAVVERINARQLWRTLIDRNVLLLAISYMCLNYVYYMLSNWCFLYLVQELHFSELASGWLATAPPLAAAVGAGAGGVITTGLFERYGSRRGLRLLPLIGLPAASLLLLWAVHAANPYWAIGELAALLWLRGVIRGLVLGGGDDCRAQQYHGRWRPDEHRWQSRRHYRHPDRRGVDRSRGVEHRIPDRCRVRVGQRGGVAVHRCESQRGQRTAVALTGLR